MTHHYCLEHDIFRNLVRSGLNHHYALSCTGYNQVEITFLELRERRVQYQFTVQVSPHL